MVFTYKTRHGTSPRGGAAVYEEISGEGRTFYKWSNDNATYTELGDVVEGDKTWSVIFATDRSPEGKVLDNSRAIGGRGDPRDLAMLRVVKAFERTPNRGARSPMRSWPGTPRSAQPETGGFYDFGGRWSKSARHGGHLADPLRRERARPHAPGRPARVTEASGSCG